MKTNRALIHLRLISATLLAGGLASCGQGSRPGDLAHHDPGLRYDVATKDCCAGRVYRTRGTAYYPHDSKLQGGFLDRRGKKLVTLQDFLDGKSKYAAVAMDKTVLPYGTNICIPHLNEKYDTAIAFRVVDTGGAFRGKRTTRMDICTRSKKHTVDPAINRSFEFVVCDEQPNQVK